MQIYPPLTLNISNLSAPKCIHCKLIPPSPYISLRRFELLQVPHQETILPLNQRLSCSCSINRINVNPPSKSKSHPIQSNQIQSNQIKIKNKITITNPQSPITKGSINVRSQQGSLQAFTKVKNC